MYGYWYSVKENFSFSRQELKELFITALAFAFTLSSYYEHLFSLGGDVRIVISDSFIGFFILSSILVFLSLYAHVTLQKLAGIKLGYKVKYSYWLNGILIGLFFSVVTLGKIPIISLFILPGAVVIEHIPKLRLGKFRYGINAKDIARVSLMGPLSHVVVITFLGIIFFASGKSPLVSHLIIANILLMWYSMLPIPKFDMAIKIDSASDGLGLFFYSRGVYILCAITFFIYGLLAWFQTTFSFVLAFILALVTITIYSIAMKTTN